MSTIDIGKRIKRTFDPDPLISEIKIVLGAQMISRKLDPIHKGFADDLKEKPVHAGFKKSLCSDRMRLRKQPSLSARERGPGSSPVALTSFGI
jgi:hypothetical protein